MSVDDVVGVWLRGGGATGGRLGLNAETAAWLLDLVQLLVRAAPPVDPADDVTAPAVPDEIDDEPALLQGTRAAALHRLLWCVPVTCPVDGTVEFATDASATTELFAAAAAWADRAASLTTRGADDRVAVWQDLRALVADIDGGVRQSRADERLVMQLQHIVGVARSWDRPASLVKTVAPADPEPAPRSRWRRRRG